LSFTGYFRWEQIENRPYLRALDCYWKALWMISDTVAGLAAVRKAVDRMPHAAHDIRQAMPFLEKRDSFAAWGRWTDREPADLGEVAAKEVEARSLGGWGSSGETNHDSAIRGKWRCRS